MDPTMMNPFGQRVLPLPPIPANPLATGALGPGAGMPMPMPPPGLPLSGGGASPPGPPPGMVLPPGAAPPPILPGGMPLPPPGLGGPPPPGPPPAPPGPPPLTPDDIIPPPDPLAQLLAVVAAFAKKEPRKPQYQFWYDPKDYPQPGESEALAKIHRDRDDYAGLIQRFADDTARIRNEAIGGFRDFDPKLEEQWRSSVLQDEDQLIAAIVGSAPPNYEMEMVRPRYDDDAELVEDWLWLCHLEAARQHQLGGHATYEMDISKSATRYGRVAAKTVLCPESDVATPPFYFKLLDPATVYPTFAGPRGLRVVTLCYQQTAAELLGDHVECYEAIERALFTGKDAKRDIDPVKVEEYWDCRWYLLFADSKLIKRAEHKLGEPPFVYTIAAYGDPTMTADPVRTASTGASGQALSARQADLARTGQSHFASRFNVEAQREAILGRLLTRLKAWGNDPLLVYQDEVARTRGMPEITSAEGGRTQIWKDHEEVREFPLSPNPPQLGPLMTASSEDVARAGLPASMFGLTPYSQQSGYSLDQLSDAGKDKLAPVAQCVAAFYRAQAEQVLRFLRDHGEGLGEEGHRGYFAVPRRAQDAPDSRDDEWRELTPELLDKDKVGTRVKVDLQSTDLRGLAPLANALQIAQKNGWTTRRDAISLLPLPGRRNPERTMKEIDIEQLNEAPEVKLGKLLKWVTSEYADDQLLQQFIMNQLQQNAAKSQRGSGSPPLPPGGNPGPPRPMQIQGGSLPGMNMPPGTQGGAPPGGGGPMAPAGAGVMPPGGGGPGMEP